MESNADTMMNREECLKHIESSRVDEPIGAAVEDYHDQFGLDEDLRKSVMRFLSSASTFNRSAVLRVLCMSADASKGLEADALLLHFQGEQANNNTDMEAASFLYQMAQHGNETAKRLLTLLNLDDWWAAYYSRNPRRE